MIPYVVDGRRSEGPSKRGARAAWALLLSFVLHGAFLGLALFVSALHLGPAPEPPHPAHAVTLRSLSQRQWEQNRSEKSAERQTEAPQAEAPHPAQTPQLVKKPEPRPTGQVVDVSPGNGESDPNARFLAESANKVKHETHAKDQTAFYRNAMPRRTTAVPAQGNGTDDVDRAQLSGNNGLGEDDRPLREKGAQKSVMEIPDVERREQIALKTQPDPMGLGLRVSNSAESEAVHGNSNRLRVQPGTAGGEAEASVGRKGTPGAANLTPSMAVLDKISGAAANDHLSDVDEGEGTFLNTKEWKFSSFFNRVKQSVGMHWDPAGQLRQRDPTGQIYGGRDRYTLLNVTLNEKGMVKDVYVEKSSGLDFLDLEAIASFQRAQPFPNPPPGLMESDATVRFQFGFFLEMGASGARLRLFRQAN